MRSNKSKCHGICLDWKISQLYAFDKGGKKCTNCNVYMLWDKNRCPCCDQILKTKPRQAKYKDRMELARL